MPHPHRGEVIPMSEAGSWATGLPWSFTANSWQYTTIYSASKIPVCRLDLEDWGVTEDNQDELERKQAEVAALIVRAVNSHEALVEALQAAEVAVAELCQDQNPANECWNILRQVRAALNIANGVVG